MEVGIRQQLTPKGVLIPQDDLRSTITQIARPYSTRRAALSRSRGRGRLLSPWHQKATEILELRSLAHEGETDDISLN